MGAQYTKPRNQIFGNYMLQILFYIIVILVKLGALPQTLSIVAIVTMMERNS